MIRKVFFKTMVGAIIIGAAIASCVEVKDLYDPEYAAKLAEYRAKWVEQFGEIDPNEDWGFGSDEETAGESTRVVTREALKETHDWEERGITPPADITEEEINKVNAYLADTENVEPIPHLNFSDFWMQQVSSSEYSTNFNQLHVVNFAKTEDVEVFDANNGETKSVYMQNAGTTGFYFISSFSGGGKIEDYIIVNIDGAYYLCFEYYDKNPSGEEIGGDGIYNDWVIKLSPSNYSSTKRIICEDLGTIGDFDFNDIVFDVSDAGLRWDLLTGAPIHEAVITVRAAGGTLPIFVGGVNIKEALGVSDNVMVNTGAVGGMDNVPPAIFRIPWPESNDLRDIEVLVKTNEAICALTAPTGDAPQKLCVPADFVWPSERVNIKSVYENFPNIGWENGKNPNGDVSEYGTLIAAEDLGNEQPIPAKYFENVGESCTITVVGKNVSVSLREYNWSRNIGIQTEQGGVASVSLTGDLLELAKKGELYCTFHYVENTVTIYVK